MLSTNSSLTVTFGSVHAGVGSSCSLLVPFAIPIGIMHSTVVTVKGCHLLSQVSLGKKKLENYFYFMCIDVLPTYMSVNCVCEVPSGARRGRQILWTRS